MDRNELIGVIGVIVAIVTLFATFFQKRIDNWITNLSPSLSSYLGGIFGSTNARTIIFLVIEALIIYLLFVTRIDFVNYYWDFYIILITSLFGLFFIFGPIMRQIRKIQSDVGDLKLEFGIIVKTRKSELEVINTKWKDFVKYLETQSGFEIIAGYLSLAEPIHLENEIIVIGLPEVILQAAHGIDTERVTPFIKEYFGYELRIKLIANE